MANLDHSASKVNGSKVPTFAEAWENDRRRKAELQPQPSIPADPTPTPELVQSEELSPLAQEIDDLVKAGFLPHLRPLAPPGVVIGSTVSDGKVPRLYVNGEWS